MEEAKTKIKRGKVSGNDNIHPEILKWIIFLESWETNKLPNDWEQKLLLQINSLKQLETPVKIIQVTNGIYEHVRFFQLYNDYSGTTA